MIGNDLNFHKVLIRAFVTNQGQVLIVKDENNGWEIPEVVLEEGEDPEDTLESDIESVMGLEMDVHQILDSYSDPSEDDLLYILFHAESDSRQIEGSEEVSGYKWVEPEEIGETLEDDSMIEERKKVEKFIEKMKKTPVF